MPLWFRHQALDLLRALRAARLNDMQTVNDFLLPTVKASYFYWSSPKKICFWRQWQVLHDIRLVVWTACILSWTTVLFLTKYPSKWICKEKISSWNNTIWPTSPQKICLLPFMLPFTFFFYFLFTFFLPFLIFPLFFHVLSSLITFSCCIYTKKKEKKAGNVITSANFYTSGMLKDVSATKWPH